MNKTIGRWLRLAAEHAESLTEVLVDDLKLSTLEVNEYSKPTRTGRQEGRERPRPVP